MPGLIANSRPELHLGDRVDFIDIRVERSLLLIEIAGAPDTARILDGMREGYEAGWIGSNMPTLVDVACFHGKIDWPAIKALSQITQWGGTMQEPSRVAYVSPDRFFAFVVKAVSILFPRAIHRLFTDRRSALIWLETSQPH
ncbi:MAG: hypothetical protein VW600_04035 [Ferrovibrio sp.]